MYVPGTVDLCLYQALILYVPTPFSIYQVLIMYIPGTVLIMYVPCTYQLCIRYLLYICTSYYVCTVHVHPFVQVLLFIIRCVCTQFIEPVISEEVLTPHSFFFYTQGRGTECGRASPYPRDLLDLRSSLGELQYNHFPVPFHNIQLSSSKNFLIIKYIVNRQDLLGYLFNFISIVHICVKKKFKTQNINPCLKPK